MQMVDGYCCNCHKPLGKVDWGLADFVFCKPCAKARDVYTPPPRSLERRLATVNRGTQSIQITWRAI
jgi:hypothetical protein